MFTSPLKRKKWKKKEKKFSFHVYGSKQMSVLFNLSRESKGSFIVSCRQFSYSFPSISSAGGE
jgi:hypothetical protein